MGSTGGQQNYFGGQNDFANYQGQSLWESPYQQRSPLQWARAEHSQFPGAFPGGIHPGYDFRPGIKAGRVVESGKDVFYGSGSAYKDITREIDKANLLLSDDPSLYWAKYMNIGYGTPFEQPTLYARNLPEYAGGDSLGFSTGTFGPPGSGVVGWGAQLGREVGRSLEQGWLGSLMDWESAFATTGLHHQFYDPGSTEVGEGISLGDMGEAPGPGFGEAGTF